MKRWLACVSVCLLPVIGSAQEPISLDLSKMVGTAVAMEYQPITNRLVLWPVSVSNYYISTTNTSIPYGKWVSVEWAIQQLRERGETTNMINRLIADGDMCAVSGHRWRNIDSQHRKCTMCGKEETKREVWE